MRRHSHSRHRRKRYQLHRECPGRSADSHHLRTTKRSKVEDDLRGNVFALMDNLSKQRDAAEQRAKQMEETAKRLQAETARQAKARERARSFQKEAEEKAQEYKKKVVAAAQRLDAEKQVVEKMRVEVNDSKAKVLKAKLLHESERIEKQEALKKAAQKEQAAKELQARVAMLGRLCRQADPNFVKDELLSGDEGGDCIVIDGDEPARCISQNDGCSKVVNEHGDQSTSSYEEDEEDGGSGGHSSESDSSDEKVGSSGNKDRKATPCSLVKQVGVDTTDTNNKQTEGKASEESRTAGEELGAQEQKVAPSEAAGGPASCPTS